MVLLLFAAGGPTRAYFTPLDLNLMPRPRHDIDASLVRIVSHCDSFYRNEHCVQWLPGVVVSYVVHWVI